MLLTCKTTVKLNNNSENIIGHMCYAAYKLWNVCNYERIHHKELDLPVNYPDWYYQAGRMETDSLSGGGVGRQLGEWTDQGLHLSGNRKR